MVQQIWQEKKTLKTIVAVASTWSNWHARNDFYISRSVPLVIPDDQVFGAYRSTVPNIRSKPACLTSSIMKMLTTDGTSGNTCIPLNNLNHTVLFMKNYFFFFTTSNYPPTNGIKLTVRKCISILTLFYSYTRNTITGTAWSSEVK